MTAKFPFQRSICIDKESHDFISKLPDGEKNKFIREAVSQKIRVVKAERKEIRAGKEL